FSANPISAVLTGPISTRPSGWPSARRGTGALPPIHLDMDEGVTPIEQHGFTIADFAPDKIVLRMFKWDVKTQSVEAIDSLDPFHTAVLARAAESEPSENRLDGGWANGDRETGAVDWTRSYRSRTPY